MSLGKKILIINYGLGNIGSVANAMARLGGDYFISNMKEDLAKADAFILPGVGAFGAAMDNLHKLDLVDLLTKEVMENKKPYLGICLGMQILAVDSVEQGFHKGLGWINGHVIGLKPSNGLSVPHVGWNNISFPPDDFFYGRIDGAAHFYFDHSFHMKCEEHDIAAICDYGGSVVASIRKDNIIATQFHPEKSQRNGLKFLRNFLNYVEAS